MSHFRYNSNAPHFPPGVQMSHFSFTSTHQVEQRFWENYWTQQSPVSPAVYGSYHWRSPGMNGHGYTYGIQNFAPSLMPGCFDELQRFLQRQFGNIYSSRGSAGALPRLESYWDTDTKVEVLEEGNSGTICRNTNISRQQKAFNRSIPQTVDPVTDELDWKSFSSELADGIAVSILDSFGLGLPVLDSSLVESVFRELEDEILSSSKDKAQITGKERYLQDTKGFMEEQEVREHSPEICHQLDEIIPRRKQSEENKNNKSQNKYSAGLENDSKFLEKECTQGFERSPETKLQKANIDIPSTVAAVSQNEQSIRGDTICSSSEQPVQHRGEINFQKSKNEIGAARKIVTTPNCSVQGNENLNIKRLNQDICLGQGHETDNGSSDPTASFFCSQDAFKEEERKFSEDSEIHLRTNVCQSEPKRLQQTSDIKAKVLSYLLDGTQESGEIQRTVQVTIAENSLSLSNTKEKTGGRVKM